MTAANNITAILQPYLKKIENVYGQALRFDDIDSEKYCYVVGAGGVIIKVSKREGSLTILVFDEMFLENTKGYLTYLGSPETLGVFVYKAPEEVKEILDGLCTVIL